MKPELLRTHKTLHLWTGVAAGLFLFIAFFAGALTLFKENFEQWAAQPNHAPYISLDESDALIGKLLKAHPEAARSITVHLEDGQALARVTWGKSGPRGPQHAVGLTPDGEVTIEPAPFSGLGEFIDHLHRTGGIPVDPEIGSAFMGIVSIFYVLALVSGLTLMAPIWMKNFLALRAKGVARRLWSDLHVLIGLVSFPFHIVIALTSIVFGLHDVIYDAMDEVIFDGELQKAFYQESPFAPDRSPPAPAPTPHISFLLERIREQAPDVRPSSLTYQGAGVSTGKILLVARNESGMFPSLGAAPMKAISGEILTKEFLPGSQRGYSAAFLSFFALHFGSYGGTPVKCAYFFLAMTGAWLFYSGNRIWIENRRRRAPKEGGEATQSRSLRFMENLTIGFCWGGVIGVALTIAVSKAIAPWAENAEIWRLVACYGAWGGCLFWSFFKGADQAKTGLWTAMAAAAALIPLSSLLSGRLWDGPIMIDAAALLCAIFAALIVRKNADGVFKIPFRKPATSES